MTRMCGGGRGWQGERQCPVTSCQFLRGSKDSYKSQRFGSAPGKATSGFSTVVAAAASVEMTPLFVNGRVASDIDGDCCRREAPEMPNPGGRGDV